MKKNLLIIFVFSLSSLITNSQTINEIKNNPEIFLYGEGSGKSLKEADAYALQSLISQISTHVEYEFSMDTKWSNTEKGKEDFGMVLNTYSSATLHNASRIVISPEPNTVVLRFIKRVDVKKVFDERKYKISDFVKIAQKAESQYRIGDALRYYYWGLILLKSLPDPNSVLVNNDSKTLMINYLPDKINEILSNVSISTNGTTAKEGFLMVRLDIRYKSEAVTNFDYRYWEGQDYSNIISAKNGIGSAEFYGVAANDLESFKLKVEYEFKAETKIDDEINNVFGLITPLSFRKSFIYVPVDAIINKRIPESREIISNSIEENTITTKRTENRALNKAEIFTYENVISDILENISGINNINIRQYFTTEGYDIYKRLILYGKAKIIEIPELKHHCLNNVTIVRSVPMVFSFENNNQQFIEDIIFHFNDDNKISSLTFGLSNKSINDIMSRTIWNENDRLTLINFLEHYKTAYALKRIDYIESIFADDALIITGNKLKVSGSAESKYKSNDIIVYNRYSKLEYIKKLKLSFDHKDFINIRFEDNTIRKGGVKGELYGVQIKQYYYSSNYGDHGYLFLLIDLKNLEEPIIHVRTWQPNKNSDGSIYGLADF